MKFTYLLINLFTILLPLLSSFEKRLNFYGKWKYYLPGMLFTAFLFLVWDYFKTKYGVWGFNDHYIIGIKFFGLPLEEILFFITVPYSCTFIYESLSWFMAKREFKYSFSPLMLIVSAASLIASFFFTQKAYTFSVLFGAGLVLPFLVRVFTKHQLHLFLMTFFISLIPMAVVNGLLTSLPVVIYDNSENLNIRVGSIPVEDFVYCLILLGMNIGLYELLKRKFMSSVV